MNAVAAGKMKPTPVKGAGDMIPVVASDKLERVQIRGADDPAVRWAGAFVVYGGHGTTQSSTIVYEIEPGGQLGWHTET